jgi:hypothetical protein
LKIVQNSQFIQNVQPEISIIQLFAPFSRSFSAPSLKKAMTLFCGVALSPRRRTVAAALRALRLSKAFLTLLLTTFPSPNDTVTILVDETYERRNGKKIAYKGWFRGAVRSSDSNIVTTQAARSLVFCVLVCVSWSSRYWALPFLILPIRSQKTCENLHRPHRGSIAWTEDVVALLRRWLSDRPIRRGLPAPLVFGASRLPLSSQRTDDFDYTRIPLP